MYNLMCRFQTYFFLYKLKAMESVVKVCNTRRYHSWYKIRRKPKAHATVLIPPK